MGVGGLLSLLSQYGTGSAHQFVLTDVEMDIRHYSGRVGTKTFDGVWFISYSEDHLPPHVHAKYADVEVIIELTPDGGIMQSSRIDAIRPRNAKRNDIRTVLYVAADHSEELHALWERTHGPSSK
jgi:hypothetical protein